MKKTVFCILTVFAMLISVSHLCLAQDYVQNYFSGVTWCANHSNGSPYSIGTVTLGGSLSANGVKWQCAKPSGGTWTSGTVAGIHNLTASGLSMGALFRLQTQGNHAGFPVKGPWAVTPLWARNGTHPNCTQLGVQYFTPNSFGINAYDGANYIMSTTSALWIPAYSTITVKQSNGQALPNTSVYLVDSTMSYRFNTELLTTGSDGKVQYCIPNKLRATDMAYMCVASQYDTANSVDVIGHAGVYYGGFFHKSALFSNASNGLSLSITMPQSSVATVKKYNAPKANQAVYIADENLTQIISDGALSTNSNGTVAFSIPTGTRFRYYVQDTNGSVFYSDALTAPSSAEIKMIAHNEPSLTAPNDQTSYDVSAAVNFSWGAVQNATDYLWLYRHSSASNWAGWYTGGDRFLNGVSFGTTGTWYWFVQALDVNGNVIAQSATRTLTTTNAPVSQQSMQPQSTDDSNLMREQADNMLAIPKKTGLRSVAGLDSIELDVPSMELSGKIRAFEEKAAVTVRHIAELDPQNALDSDAVVIDMPEIKIPLYNELYQVKSLNKEELENALQDDDSMVDEFEEWDESDFYLDWLYGYGFDDSSHEGNCPCEEDHEPAFEDEDLLLEEELLLEEYF